MGLLQLTVDSAAAGMRLDLFIAQRWSAPEATDSMSRAAVQKLIDAGHVTVNGGRVKAGVRLKMADRIAVEVPAVRETGLLAEPLPLAILHEDEDIVVINKAAGMVVHPAAGCGSGTLVNAILHHCPEIAGIGGERRPGIVHRLDKDTSGVMVVAKNDLALRSLVEQFKSRTVRKEYVALVHGCVSGEDGQIDRAIGRHRSDRKRMSSLSVTGKSREATTRWIVEHRFALPIAARVVAWYCWLRLIPRTGRTHQIRVHLADMGHPLVGDLVYGQRRATATQDGLRLMAIAGISRQALHAEKLSFDHVRSGARLEFQAPLADDMANLIAALKIYQVDSDSPRAKSSSASVHRLRG